jgi:hypothetical protein
MNGLYHPFVKKVFPFTHFSLYLLCNLGHYAFSFHRLLKEKSTKGLVMSLLSVWSIPKAKLLS